MLAFMLKAKSLQMACPFNNAFNIRAFFCEICIVMSKSGTSSLLSASRIHWILIRLRDIVNNVPMVRFNRPQKDISFVKNGVALMLLLPFGTQNIAQTAKKRLFQKLKP